jgi:hypothetical protein
MRRRRREWLIFAALPLCVLALWVRSYSAVDQFGGYRVSVVGGRDEEHCWGLFLRHGTFALAISEYVELGEGWAQFHRTERYALRPGTRYGLIFNSDGSWACMVPSDDSLWAFIGLQYYWGNPEPASSDLRWDEQRRFVTVPCWLVFALTAFYPTRRAWQLARALGRCRRWRRLNRCFRCAYDLTGNTSGICPECGTVIAAHRLSRLKHDSHLQTR